jgi:type IV pilus assembly protein PilN
MILINLLPHREAARKHRREVFYAQVGLALATGALVAGLVFVWFDFQIGAQRERNDFIRAEIVKLDAQIKDVANLKAQLDGLKARQASVESLQADRNLPVHLLDEMVKQLPDGVYLTSLRQDGQGIAMAGVAQSQERVSELLRNLGHQSPWLTKPVLVEIVAADVNVPQRGTRRVSNFSIRATLTRGPDAAAAPPAAPAAKPADKV